MLPEAGAVTFLGAEFARRGWHPLIIWVDYKRLPLPTGQGTPK